MSDAELGDHFRPLAGVVYLNHGLSHLTRLAVSLWSLRKHYSGRVVLLDTGNSGFGAKLALGGITGDQRLGVQFKRIPIYDRGRQPVFITKSYVWRYAGLDAAIQVDADTVFNSSPKPLIELAADPAGPGIVLTPNRGHDTSYEYVRNRIMGWQRISAPGIDIAGLIRDASSGVFPLVNAGIIAWRADSPFLPKWEQLTKAGWVCRLTDEVAAQLLMSREPYRMAGRWWNVYPQDKAIEPERVRIWHFHGNSHAGHPGNAIWMPAYREAWESNAGGIQEWGPLLPDAQPPHPTDPPESHPSPIEQSPSPADPSSIDLPSSDTPDTGLPDGTIPSDTRMESYSEATSS
jgi:hypothetical protein